MNGLMGSASDGHREGVRVGLVVDQRMVLELLAETLTHAGHRVRARCSRPEELIDRLRDEELEVAVMDLAPDDDPGLEPGWNVVQYVREWYPEVKLVVLSSRRDAIEQRRAIELGVVAYLEKATAGIREVLAAIEAAATGAGLIPVAMMPLASSAPAVQEVAPALAQLTEREREVLHYVAAGADNMKIASLLDISERTVRAHVSSLYRKLAQENRTQLALLGRRLGLRPPSRV